MDEKMFYCAKCGSTYSGNGYNRICPDCGIETKPMLISAEEWRIKTPEQKEEFKKNLKSNLENVNTIVENSMAQDIHNIAEDIHFMKNVLIIYIILSIIGAILSIIF